MGCACVCMYVNVLCVDIHTQIHRHSDKFICLVIQRIFKLSIICIIGTGENTDLTFLLAEKEAIQINTLPIYHI